MRMSNNVQHCGPIYKGNEFEALKLAYQAQTELLRYQTQIDLRILAGYFTAQFVFGGWLAGHRPHSLSATIGLLIIDVTMAFIAAWLLYHNFRRRREVSATVHNINDALGFTISGAYLPGKSIQEQAPFRTFIWIYLALIFITTIGIGFVGLLP